MQDNSIDQSTDLPIDQLKMRNASYKMR